MLSGRALEMHAKMFGVGSSAMTKEDWIAVRSTFLNFDEVTRILRALPTSLILVLRNLNIVRSLNRELGCPVNRFNIMARRCVGTGGSDPVLPCFCSAIRGSHAGSQSGYWSPRRSLQVWAEQTGFELRLL